MNNYLKERVKQFYDIAANFEGVVGNLYESLEEDYVSCEQASEFNFVIEEIYSEGSYIIQQVCRLYQMNCCEKTCMHRLRKKKEDDDVG